MSFIINGLQFCHSNHINKNCTTAQMWHYAYDGIRNYLHREDGPATVHTTGKKQWYFHNKLHRLDGPAIELTNSYSHWYVDGHLHREDGPAFENKNRKEYWHYGLMHRLDGPAIIREDGSISYYQYGKLHREDGPAEKFVTNYNTDKYWLCGIRYSYQEYCQLIKVDIDL